MHNKDKAICIRVIDYSETSQILTFFTRQYGKIGVIAKGSKRSKSSAFGGAIEMLARGEILFTSRGTSLATLVEFHQIYDVVSALPRNLANYYGVLLGTELLTNLTHEHETRMHLFDAFERFLLDIIASKHDLEGVSMLKLLIVFQLTLLNDSGIAPIFNACVNCSNPYTDNWHNVYFSSLANGLICTDCEMSFPERINLDKTAVQTLISLQNLTHAPKHILIVIERMLIHHFTGIMHRPPKMARFIEM